MKMHAMCTCETASLLFIQHYTIKYFSKEKNAGMKQNTTTLWEENMANVNHMFTVFALNPILVTEKNHVCISWSRIKRKLSPSFPNCLTDLNKVTTAWYFYWSLQWSSLFTLLPQGRSECRVIFTESAPGAGSKSVGNHWLAQGQDKYMCNTSSSLRGYSGRAISNLFYLEYLQRNFQHERNSVEVWFSFKVNIRRALCGCLSLKAI